MAIHVKIRKIGASNNMGDYVIYGDSKNNSDFYMRINRDNKILSFFIVPDFSDPVLSLDIKDQDAPIEKLPGVSMAIYSRAISQGIKALNMDEWPNILDYCA